MSTMITFPCMDCPDRFVGCHSVCKRYQAAKATNDAHRAAVQALAEKQAIASNFHRENVDRIKKRLEMH